MMISGMKSLLGELIHAIKIFDFYSFVNTFVFGLGVDLKIVLAVKWGNNISQDGEGQFIELQIKAPKTVPEFN